MMQGAGGSIRRAAEIFGCRPNTAVQPEDRTIPNQRRASLSLVQCVRRQHVTFCIFCTVMRYQGLDAIVPIEPPRVAKKIQLRWSAAGVKRQAKAKVHAIYRETIHKIGITSFRAAAKDNGRGAPCIIPSRTSTFTSGSHGQPLLLSEHQHSARQHCSKHDDC